MIPKFKGDENVDKSSLSYIRGRYGPGSKEYIDALLAHNRCYSGTPLHEGGTTTVSGASAMAKQTANVNRTSNGYWGTRDKHNAIESKPRRVEAPAPKKPKPVDEVVEFNAAAAINAMSQEERTHQEPLVRREGETPLEFAKRKRAASQ